MKEVLTERDIGRQRDAAKLVEHNDGAFGYNAAYHHKGYDTIAIRSDMNICIGSGAGELLATESKQFILVIDGITIRGEMTDDEHSHLKELTDFFSRLRINMPQQPIKDEVL